MTIPAEPSQAFRLLRNSTTKATDHELQKYDIFTRYGQNANAFRLRHSQSLARRRQRLSHAMVRSTIQRLGRTTKLLT